jgi:hypothetical protein
MWKALRILAALLLLLGGALAGLIPFVPGWPLGLAGLLILAEYFPGIRQLLRRLRVWLWRRTGYRFPARWTGRAAK